MTDRDDKYPRPPGEGIADGLWWLGFWIFLGLCSLPASEVINCG